MTKRQYAGIALALAGMLMFGSVAPAFADETTGTEISITDQKTVDKYKKVGDKFTKQVKKYKTAEDAGKQPQAITDWKIAKKQYDAASKAYRDAVKALEKTRKAAIKAAYDTYKAAAKPTNDKLAADLAAAKSTFDAAVIAAGTDQAALDAATAANDKAAADARAAADAALAPLKATRDAAIDAAKASFDAAVTALGPKPVDPPRPTGKKGKGSDTKPTKDKGKN